MKKITYCALVGVCCVAAVAVVITVRRGPSEKTVGRHQELSPTYLVAKDTKATHSAKGTSVESVSPPKKLDLGGRSEAWESRVIKPDSVSEREKDAHTFSRPEDRGEDLSGLDQGELVKRLSQSKDKIELRKAAKVLGDRSIAGTLNLSEEEKAVVTNMVQHCLKQTKSKDANERVEARQQIERLWWVAAPTLFENIDGREGTIAETAIKGLVLMRSEDILRGLMGKVTAAKDAHTRAMAIFALGKMTEKRESLIPGRTCMNEKESAMITDKLLRPFLTQTRKTETNAVVLEAISQAIEDLRRAADRRKQVTYEK